LCIYIDGAKARQIIPEKKQEEEANNKKGNKFIK
jgi:hypothetical protein